MATTTSKSMTGKKVDTRRWQDGGITSFSETCFAEYWDDVPTPQNLVVQNGGASATKGVDPYNFKHRMALGKYLIENSGGASVWGDGLGLHWYWGYLVQLDWQWRSGRFADPATATKAPIHEEFDMNISRKTWFGYMNLDFTVAVYRGAAKAGLVPDVSFISVDVTGEAKELGLNPDIESDPCFIKCVSIWEAFFRGPHATFLSKYDPKCSKQERQQLIDNLYEELWPTHSHIIEVSLPHGRQLEKLMPDIEREFALGWANMVELLSAMRFTLLSLDALMLHGSGYLPSLILDKHSSEGGVHMTWLLENRKDEYNAAIQMMDIHKASSRELSIMCGFFRRFCRWEAERQQMPVTLKILSKKGTHDSLSILISDSGV